MTTIKSTLRDGINPRTSADVNTLGLALSGLLRSPDDNSGKPRLAPAPHPFAVLLGAQDERTVAVGPSQRYQVRDGELFCITNFGGLTNSAQTFTVTLADASTIEIGGSASPTPIDGCVILGPGDAIATGADAFCSGTVCAQPGDWTVQSMVLSDSARYTVPDDAAYLLTAAFGSAAAGATLRIDGRNAIRAPNITGRATGINSQNAPYFERNLVQPVVCAPGQILDSASSTTILVTGLLLPILGTVASATDLVTTYSDGEVRPAEALNRPGRLLRGAGITDDNTGNPIDAPGIIPVPVRIAVGAVQAVAIQAPQTYTVPTGKLLILNNFYGQAGTVTDGEIIVTLPGGSTFVLLTNDATGSTPIGATAAALIVLAAGDIITCTEGCFCAGTLIDLPAMVAGRVLTAITNSTSYTVPANERLVVTAALQAGQGVTAIALTVGGVNAAWVDSLGGWQSASGALSTASVQRVRLRPFIADMGQVLAGNSATSILLNGIRYSVA